MNLSLPDQPIDWQARCERAEALSRKNHDAAMGFQDRALRAEERVEIAKSNARAILAMLQTQTDATEKTERERDALVVMLRANVSDATFETLSVIDSVAKYRAMESELAAIKGRLEWGRRNIGTSDVSRSSEADVRDWATEFPHIYEVVSRYQSGPWDPQPCQQCGGEGGGWIDGHGSVFIKCGACGGKEPAEPSVEVPE